MENGLLKKNSIVTVEFMDLSYEGLGVAKHNGFVIFVEGALPEEKGKVRINKVVKRYAYGELVELEVKSKYRVPVENTVLHSTIPMQHLQYDQQLLFKSKIVKDSFSKVEALKEVTINETLGAKEPWHYRNKTQVPVRLLNGKMEVGVYSNNSHDLTPVSDFKINLPGIDEMVAAIKDILIEFGEKPYNEKTHTGNIRHLIVRQGYHTKEAMVVIVTRSKSLFPTSKIIPAILEKFPNVVSIIHNINGKRTSSALGEVSKVLHGSATYKEEILGKTFTVSERSFLQVNTPQAEVLYQKAIELLDLQSSDVVLDAYCGIGTITLNLADRVKEVIGIEVLPEAVNLAKENAKNNSITNVSFACGLVEEVVSDLEISPNVVVVDPPRKGLEEAFTNYLTTLQPEKIAYISCNPATLVRDLKQLVKAGYQVTDVQPVDMFPQTKHVETIVLIQRKTM